MRWVVLTLYLALAGAAVATALATAEESGAEATVLAASGSFELSNSEDGAPIFTAAGIGPGDSASGTVEVGVSGAAAELTLTPRDLADSPGLGGGLLSAQLALRVRELTGAPQTVYSGPLATMPAQSLGRIDPGTPRSFEFVATLPEAGTGVSQNAVQGASTSVAFAWEASEAGAEEPPGEPQGDELDLLLVRVRHRIKHGRLLVLARCDRPCAIAVRGRLRADLAGDRRGGRVRLTGRPKFVAGTQRLRIRLPGRLRHWLAQNPGRERVRVKATFVARDAAGHRDRVRRTLKLRSAR